jgi:hypothetical protein
MMKGMIVPLTITLLTTSCIFDFPNDSFDDTVWVSNEVPLGPFDVSTLTLEFQCNCSASINITTTSQDEQENETTIYGTYSADDQTVVFKHMVINLRDLDVTFMEAHLSGQTLFLLWRIENSIYPFTTPLHAPDSPAE